MSAALEVATRVVRSTVSRKARGVLSERSNSQSLWGSPPQRVEMHSGVVRTFLCGGFTTVDSSTWCFAALVSLVVIYA